MQVAPCQSTVNYGWHSDIRNIYKYYLSKNMSNNTHSCLMGDAWELALGRCFCYSWCRPKDCAILQSCCKAYNSEMDHFSHLIHQEVQLQIST